MTTGAWEDTSWPTGAFFSLFFFIFSSYFHSGWAWMAATLSLDITTVPLPSQPPPTMMVQPSHINTMPSWHNQGSHYHNRTAGDEHNAFPTFRSSASKQFWVLLYTCLTFNLIRLLKAPLLCRILSLHILQDNLTFIRLMKAGRNCPAMSSNHRYVLNNEIAWFSSR